MCGYYVIDYFVKLNTAQVQVLTYRFSTKYKQVVIQVTLICFLDSNLKINFDFVLNGIESFVCVFYRYYAITTLYSPMTYCINSLAIFNFHKTVLHLQVSLTHVNYTESCIEEYKSKIQKKIPCVSGKPRFPF